MVVLSVIIITPPDPGPRVKGEKIRLDDIIHGKFKPNPFNATWHSGKYTIKLIDIYFFEMYVNLLNFFQYIPSFFLSTIIR